MKSKIVTTVIILLTFSSCEWFGEDEPADIEQTVTDIDNNTYRTVKIGNQVWMAENLKTTHYPDGREIRQITSSSYWANLSNNNTADFFCYYFNNMSGEKDIYGTLYTYAAAMGDNAVSSNRNPSGIQGVCPSGWHLPSEGEWEELIDTRPPVSVIPHAHGCTRTSKS